MGDIIRQPFGMKTNYDAELRNVNRPKNYTKSRVQTSLKSKTKAETANIYTLPRGAYNKGANLHLQQVKVRKLYKSYWNIFTNDK